MLEWNCQEWERGREGEWERICVLPLPHSPPLPLTRLLHGTKPVEWMIVYYA